MTDNFFEQISAAAYESAAETRRRRTTAQARARRFQERLKAFSKDAIKFFEEQGVESIRCVDIEAGMPSMRGWRVLGNEVILSERGEYYYWEGQVAKYDDEEEGWNIYERGFEKTEAYVNVLYSANFSIGNSRLFALRRSYVEPQDCRINLYENGKGEIMYIPRGVSFRHLPTERERNLFDEMVKVVVSVTEESRW